MTKTKLKTPEAKTISSLSKDINRLRKHCENYRRRAEDFKLWVKQADKLFVKMLKEGRITKKELNQYFKKRPMR